ncbi:MAG: thioredoxin fold domain-containing protein, partial [Betaproteobacteria bacterium]|nr:thioredoxin fold domain-containing protein [Betaproteobacteria bacterium]
EWSPSDALRVREARAFDPLTGRIAVNYIYSYASGARHEYAASFRVYTFTELRDLLGRAVKLGGLRGDGRNTVLLFVSPTCPMCKKLLPIAKSILRSERAAAIVLASDGEEAEQRAFVQREGLEALPYVLSRELGMSYQVGKLPYAVLIDAEGVIRAKGLVNTREHFESLFEARDQGVGSLQDYLRAERA